MHTSEQSNPMVETSHFSVVPAECADTASGALLGREVEACSSGSDCKATARPASRAVVSLISNSAAAASPFPLKPLLLPFLEKEDCRFRIIQPLTYPGIPKGELSSDGVSCHSLELFGHESDKTRLEKFEIHFSDVCERKFVMFDRCGSKRRVIFHPSTIYEFPTLLRSPLKVTNYEGFTRDEGHLKETLVKPLLSDDCASLDAMLPPGWRSTPWNCEEEDTFPALYGTDAEGHCLDVLSAGLSKENTEELDALLWSDDEMSSTGHSPSGLTSSDADDSLNPIDSGGHGGYCCKKRKACLEADTESTATSGSATLNKVFLSDGERLGRSSGYGGEGLTVFDLSSASEESSSGSCDSQRQHQTRNSTYRRLVKKTRKDKIQSTLQFLRSMIPGGESMEAALVLGETIQYVKNLQVEVEQLAGNVFK